MLEKGGDRTIAITTAAILGMTVLVVFLLERSVDDADAGRLHSGIQMLAGSSWPSWGTPPDRLSFWFSVGAAWHLALNLIPAVGIGWILLALLEQRRERMQLLDMLKLRDRSIRNALAAELERAQPSSLSKDQRAQVEATVDRAFEEGAKFWAENQLPTLVGRRRAKSILRQPIESE